MRFLVSPKVVKKLDFFRVVKNVSFLEFQRDSFFSAHKGKTKENGIFGEPKSGQKVRFFRIVINLRFLEFQKSHFFSPHKAKTNEQWTFETPKVVKKCFFFSETWNVVSILVVQSPHAATIFAIFFGRNRGVVMNILSLPFFSRRLWCLIFRKSLSEITSDNCGVQK